MRKEGFSLYSIETYKHARRVLPVSMYKEKTGKPIAAPTSMGQVIWGNALYFRDIIMTPIREIEDKQLVKLISFLEIFSLPRRKNDG